MKKKKKKNSCPGSAEAKLVPEKKKDKTPSGDGVLLVTVVNGVDLTAKDRNGLSDPYCKLKIGSRKAVTRTQPATLTPTWQESFRFDGVGLADSLRLTCMDFDRVGSDDFMGIIDVPLHVLVGRTAPLDAWFDLCAKSASDEVSGAIRLQLVFQTAPTPSSAALGSKPVKTRKPTPFTEVAQPAETVAAEGAAPGDGAGEAAVAPLAATVAVRDGDKNTEKFRRLFRMPRDEELILDVGASLLRTIARSGRLYLSSRHLCFYSNLFGSRIIEVLPLADIAAIDPLPNPKHNGFLVKMGDGEAFSFRDVARHESTNRAVRRQHWAVTRPGMEVPSHLLEPAGASSSSFSSSSAGGARRIPSTDGDSLTETAADNDDAPDDDPRFSSTEVLDAGGFLSSELAQPCVEAEFDCTAARFFELFFSDASPFGAFYRGFRGDTDYVQGKWVADEALGNVRMLEFRSLVKTKAPFAPPTTAVVENQRYARTANRLVIEMAGSYKDVPFGDYFRVESRWEVVEEGGRCRLTVRVGVNFTKSTWLKGKITGGVTSECKTSFEGWVAEAKKELQAKGKGSAKDNDSGVVSRKPEGAAAGALAAPQPVAAAAQPAKAQPPKANVAVAGEGGSPMAGYFSASLPLLFLIAVVMLLVYRVGQLSGRIEALEAMMASSKRK
jgi:hypothetical protein